MQSLCCTIRSLPAYRETLKRREKREEEYVQVAPLLLKYAQKDDDELREAAIQVRRGTVALADDGTSETSDCCAGPGSARDTMPEAGCDILRRYGEAGE